MLRKTCFPLPQRITQVWATRGGPEQIARVANAIQNRQGQTPARNGDNACNAVAYRWIESEQQLLRTFGLAKQVWSNVQLTDVGNARSFHSSTGQARAGHSDSQ